MAIRNRPLIIDVAGTVVNINVQPIRKKSPLSETIVVRPTSATNVEPIDLQKLQ